MVKRYKQNKLAVLGALLLTFLIIVALFAEVIAPFDPTEINLANTYAKPSGEHFLGTDALGRDVFSRLIHGARISLGIGFLATFFTMCIGVSLGSIAGYYGGIVDSMLMRGTDFMLNFPFLLLVLTFIAILEEINIVAFVAIIALTSWPTMTRIIRGIFLQLREQEFVQAAKALGCSDGRIILQHLLPNAFFPIIVQATLTMATMIMVESGLSFLGFGIAEPTPTWGNMMSDAQSILVLQRYPHLWIPPGLAILVTVLAINFIGDGLRDSFDPRQASR